MLQDYLPRFAQRFGVPAAQPGTAYRPLPPDLDPESICCFKYQRTVGNDNVVRLGEHRLQIQPNQQRASYSRAMVELHEHVDGSLAVYHQGRRLVITPAPAEAPVLRARGGRRVPGPLAGERSKLASALTVIAAPVDKWATREPASVPLRDALVHLSTGGQHHRPGDDHPWRKPLKRRELTKSLNT